MRLLALRKAKLYLRSRRFRRNLALLLLAVVIVSAAGPAGLRITLRAAFHLMVFAYHATDFDLDEYTQVYGPCACADPVDPDFPATL